jgi:hypothetical protein
MMTLVNMDAPDMNIPPMSTPDVTLTTPAAPATDATDAADATDATDATDAQGAFAETSAAGGAAGAAERRFPHQDARSSAHNGQQRAGGLLILPTHRVIHSLPVFDPQQFLAQLQALGASVVPLPSLATESLLAALAAASAAAAFVLILRERIGASAYLLTFSPQVRIRALPNLANRRRELDMVLLHEGIFAPLLQIDPAAVREGQFVRYQRDADEAIAAVVGGEAQLAFLVNPVTLQQLRENTFAGEVMPQKSTDFYPKLLSGLTIYALDPSHGSASAPPVEHQARPQAEPGAEPEAARETSPQTSPQTSRKDQR